jgi:hypothetical protein
MAMSKSKIKWISIYITIATVGLFAGANLLGGSVGLFLCKHINGGDCNELGELNAYLYGGLIGVGVFLLAVTLIKKRMAAK